MAFPSALTSRVLIAANGVDGPDYYQAGDSNLKPGMVCMEDDADEVKICTSTGVPLGIVGCDADHDLGTVYSAGERIPVWKLGSGVDIYVLCADNTTITVTKSSVIETADLTTYKGKGKVIETFVAGSTTWAASVVSVRNATARLWIGRALETGSITSGVSRYVPVKLSV